MKTQMYSPCGLRVMQILPKTYQFEWQQHTSHSMGLWVPQNGNKSTQEGLFPYNVFGSKNIQRNKLFYHQNGSNAWFRAQKLFPTVVQCKHDSWVRETGRLQIIRKTSWDAIEKNSRTHQEPE
mmetsp:Transcript_12281/g.13997  ORF Transcript_12281/g.13997 Transcript_12281/m.13997 type:complete len:123 (-) Transcript_12281:1144-1512(-)